MFFFRQFEEFDPVSGDVPEHPFSHLPEIASRARSLLTPRLRNTDQVVAAATRINKEITNYFRDVRDTEIIRLRDDLTQPRNWRRISPRDEADFRDAERFFEWHVHGPDLEDGEWAFKDGMEDELDIPTENNTSEVDALKSVIDNRVAHNFFINTDTEPEPNEYPEGRDYELFAVLSLWLLVDALSFVGKSKEGLSIAGGYAIKAMDAVCYAEHLKDEDLLRSALNASFERALGSQKAEVQECALANAARAVELYKKGQAEMRVSAARQLNEKRHAKRNETRELVLGEWEKIRSNFFGAEAAGRHFADWLETQGIVYTPRTVTGWIREHAKKIGVRLR